MMVVMCMIHILPTLACRIGLVDEPNSRKQHEGCIPLIGGLAIYCGFIAGISLFYTAPWLKFPSLVFGGLMLVLVGMLDDLLELRKRVRIPAQVVAALLMAVFGGKVLQDLSWLIFGDLLSLSVLAIPFTIFCTGGVVNAVNMADGLDGLAGGLVLVAFGSLAYLAYDSGSTRDLDVLLLLMACIVGFLIFNARSPWCKMAKVFMGDAGSMFLGFALARFLIDFSQGDQRVMHLRRAAHGYRGRDVAAYHGRAFAFFCGSKAFASSITVQGAERGADGPVDLGSCGGTCAHRHRLPQLWDFRHGYVGRIFGAVCRVYGRVEASGQEGLGSSSNRRRGRSRDGRIRKRRLTKTSLWAFCPCGCKPHLV